MARLCGVEWADCEAGIRAECGAVGLMQHRDLVTRRIASPHHTTQALLLAMTACFVFSHDCI